MVPPRRASTDAKARLQVSPGGAKPWSRRPVPAAPTPAARPSGTVWWSIAEEFGLLQGPAVDALLGPSSPPAGCLAADRRILGVATRAGRVLYPGFQFDSAARSVRPLIAGVARIGRTSGCRDRRILAWFCLASGSLGGERPVDRLEEAYAVLAAAEADFRWDRRVDPLN
ncbi:hypothetical protein [Arthrobacter sp. B0490]|uniref:hypothetical protein n=1 Tax=Arthrobacter sp. B0490 TaxID=2058891 RepID=UPI0011B0D626|nr:hypothetical protein [Arthrobacter sp. B0490]